MNRQKHGFGQCLLTKRAQTSAQVTNFPYDWKELGKWKYSCGALVRWLSQVPVGLTSLVLAFWELAHRSGQWKQPHDTKVSCSDEKSKKPYTIKCMVFCFFHQQLQGQVAKHNYSLRSNSVKHFLPELTHFCIRKCKNIVPLSVCGRNVRRLQPRSLTHYVRKCLLASPRLFCHYE